MVVHQSIIQTQHNTPTRASKISHLRLTEQWLGSLNNHGAAKTTWKIMNHWGVELYKIIKTPKTNHAAFGEGFDKFKFNLIKDYRFRNMVALLWNLYKKSQVAFKVLCVQVNKKYRKKLKKRYAFQLNYIPVNLRQRFFNKILSKIVHQSTGRGFASRYLWTLKDCLFNYDSSTINGFKKSILKKLMKKPK